MNTFSPWAALSRAVAAAAVVAVFMLGAASLAVHPGDGCNDDACATFGCDMATGSGCSTQCVHAAAALTGAKPTQSPRSILVIAGPYSGPGLRLPDRPFRPPALS